MSTWTRRRVLAAGAAVCFAVAMVFGANTASAVHDDGIFELDGNALAGPAPGDDWSVIFDNASDECATLAAADPDPVKITACSFAHDPADATIFTGGGSKDQQEVQTSWQHSAGSVPPKDDLLDAFAAQYDNGNLYFGADRYATNGDAQIGFWFFHNEITVNADGSFTGVHVAHDDNGTPNDFTDDTNGDILVLSNFTNGGTVPNIRVFEWYGVDDVRQLTGVPENSLCAPALVNDKACAITSVDNVPSAWPFVPKSGPPNEFDSGAFYEGGIDLEALGFGGDCFSSFLAETRASTSITATLKDFVGGQLGECGVTVATQASHTTVSIGDGTLDVSDQATITGTGSVSAPNPTGSVDFHLCGPSATVISTCAATPENLAVPDVTLTGLTNPAVVNSGPFEVTSAGYYCWTAAYSGDDNYDPQGDDGLNECFRVTPVQPDLTTTATAGPVDLGDPISDVAHLTGTTLDPDGNPAGGTITFVVYGPDSASCAEADIATTLGPFPVTGDGNYASGNFIPTVPGVYKWIATYTPDPDDPNNLGDAGACGDAGESSTVNQDQPTLSTNQSWVPQDSVTIVAPAGGALKGTASFALYETDDCTGTAVYDEEVAVDSATPATVGTSNTGDPLDNGGYTASAEGTTQYSWQVSYDSDNGGQAGIDPTCVEVSTLTIDNDNTPTP